VDDLLDTWNPDHDKESTRYYNTHTLLVRSGLATNEQLSKCISEAIKESNISCEFQTNLIVGRNGRYYGFGYLWVSNSQIYHMLLGKNYDGSDRIENREDPNWESPSKSLEQEISEIAYDGCWANYVDLEEEIRDRYTPKILTINLPSLINVHPFYYTQDQKEIIRELAAEKRIKGVIPDKYYFKFYPASVPLLDDNYCHNVLCCREVDNWITEKDLKRVFEKFSTDNQSKNTRKLNGKLIMDTYPFITLNDRKMAFITFDPKSYDAQFALQMTKKTIIERNNKKALLIFSQSYKSKNQRE
jgi:hypothetical protein